MDLNEALKALADPNRLRIINLLQGKTLCVCDIEDVLKLNQSNLSRHLAKLKQAGLVTAKKQGLFMYYAQKPLEPPYGPIIEALYEKMATDETWAEDRKQLAKRKDCC